jgi:hypothetical protein
MDAAPRNLESRCQLILRQWPVPMLVRTYQCIAQNSFSTFPCKPETRCLLIEQFTMLHHSKMFQGKVTSIRLPSSKAFMVWN